MGSTATAGPQPTQPQVQPTIQVLGQPDPQPSVQPVNRALPIAGSGNEGLGTCARFTSDQESCLECVANFHLFEGRCYVNIHGCVEYVLGNICRRCDAGFILVNNECCDKHCMARIFREYNVASVGVEETQEQKLKRLTVEGYESTVTLLTKTFITTANYQFLSTSNQILSGVIRYSIRIMVNKVVYKCIADFELEKKKVSVLEFRPEAQLAALRETVITEKELLNNELAKQAFQFVSTVYGLRIIGMSLERSSFTPYKYGMEFKFIYLSGEKSFFFQVVATSKKYVYLTWMEERTDVSVIKKFVEESIKTVKIEKEPSFQTIKEFISTTSQITNTQVDVKTI